MSKRLGSRIPLFVIGLICLCLAITVAKRNGAFPGTSIEQKQSPPAAQISSALKNDGVGIEITEKKISKAKIHEGVFGEFETWAQQYAAQTAPAKAALEPAGIALAQKRRDALKAVITAYPKHALELAIGGDMRKALPASVENLLESNIDTRATFMEILSCDCKNSNPQCTDCAKKNKLYQVSYGTKVFNANIYGDVKVAKNVAPVPVKGIGVDLEMAVDESSGSYAVASREGYLGGALQITNPNELPEDADIGKKTYLLVRINFADDTTEPINEYTAYETLRQLNQYYNEDSYGKVSFLPTVTPLITMPKTKQWYKLNDNTTQPLGSPPYWGNCKSDALAAAAAAGYDPAQYDFVGLRFNYVGPGLSGRPMLLPDNGAPLWVHELGHDLGFPHANAYVSPTPDSPGVGVEYGNPFDVMGSGGEGGGVGTTIGHNNITFKNLIAKWLPDFYINQIPPQSKGTYRIYAMDYGSIDPANKYGLRILKDDYRDVWVEFRQNQFQADPFLPNGVNVNYSVGFWGNSGGATVGSGLLRPSDNWGGYLPSQNGLYPPNRVLNIASRSSAGSDVLLVGETMADSKAGIYITPVAKNATTPASMDLVVNVGDFSAQPVPTIQPLTAVPAPNIHGVYHATDSVTFTATAADSAGNPLAYFWDFNDGTYSTDNLPSQTHKWSKFGTYRVRCIVSDMMGHRASSGKTIYVTDASDVAADKTVTGSCTVLADTAAGVEGVQVSGCGETVYSDSDGGYLMHNISGGTPIGVKEGYRADLPPHPTSPASADPYWNTFQASTPIASGGSTTNADLTSCHLATVSFSPATASVAEGQTLNVTITRNFNVGSNTTVAEQNAYNYWLNTNTPVTAWVPEILGDGANGGAYGVHSVQDVLQMITIKAISSNGPTAFTSTSLHVVGVAPAPQHIQWDFTMPAGCTQVTAQITFKSLGTKSPPRVLEFILQDSKGRSDGTLGGYTATNPTNGQMVVTVTDPLAPPAASLLATQSAAVEGGANGQFTVKLNKPTAANTAVRFNVVAQSAGESGSTTKTWGNPQSAATWNTDYILKDGAGSVITLGGLLVGTVTIPTGQTSAVINVQPLDNGKLTPNLVVDLQLLADTAPTATYILDVPNEAAVNIADKTPLPILSIVATSPVCSEGSDGVFTVTRISSDLSLPMTVPYSIGGSALNGADYKRLSGSVVIPAGSNSATITIHTFSETLKDNGKDALLLPGSPEAEMVTLALKSDTAWSIDFAHYKDSVVINNVGGNPFVSVQTGNAGGTTGGLVDESAGGKAGWFKFSRLNTKGDLVINYTVSGTAVAAVDYTVDAPAHPPANQAVTFNGTITIPNGFTEAYVNLNIFFANMGVIEDTKTIIVDITPSGAYDIDPSGAEATLLITDANQITSGPYTGTTVNSVTLTSTNRLANEATLSPGNFWVERSGSGGAASSPLTVNFKFKSGPGYGVQGVDFKLVAHNSGITLTNSVTIPAGVQFASIDVVPIDNNVSEGTLKVTMTIAPMTDALNNPYSVGIPNTDTVKISDGDGPGSLPTASFDLASDHNIARPLTYQIPVSLSAPVPVGQIATVDYHISGGTALILADYDLVPNKEIFGGTLTFNAGQQHQFIKLDILNTKRLADLTIFISLTDAYNAVIGPPSTFVYTIDDPTPAINSLLHVFGALGTPFSYTITATNGPTSFTATGLPSWASFNPATGVISGTPDAVSSSNVTITATNSFTTGTATLVITINPPVPPVITSSLTVSAFVGFPYNPLYQITANNFPNAFGATGLPAGLAINTQTGVISGTPTSPAGTYNVSISASNLGGADTKTLVITLAKPPPPVISSATSGNAVAGWPYSYQVTASNFPSSFSASGLPAGLSMNTATGLISGAAGGAGVFTVNLSATNAGGTGTATLTLTVVLPSAPVINSSATASGVYLTPFNYQIGGTNIPLSFGATGLPAWASINTSTGAISGTPDVIGTSTVTVSATNLGGTGTATLTITIADIPTPAITSATSATGTNGVPFQYQIQASNGPLSYSASDLPAGLSIDTATGLISGTPPIPGAFNVTIGATNHGGTGTAVLVISIAIDQNSGPILLSGVGATPNPAAVNENVTFTGFAADPFPSSLFYSWSFGDGIGGSGATASHAYTAAGTYTATVSVLDGIGKTTTGSVTVVVGTGGGVGGPILPGGSIQMTVSKLQGMVKTKPGHDSVSIVGVLPNISGPFQPKGQLLALDFSGAKVSFTLDAKGKSKSGASRFQFKLKANKKTKTNPTPGFVGGNLSFTAKLVGTLAADMKMDPTQSAKNAPITMTATIQLGGIGYVATINAKYSGSPKSGGKFKK
jgi:hypothetical protein